MLSKSSPRVTCVVFSPLRDPFWNQAYDIYLQRVFAKQNPKVSVLFLRQSSPVVVIGRGQNAYEECDFKAMRKHSVPLLRRHTGGGAVYQDKGSINYSFLFPKEEYNRDQVTEAVVDSINQALKTFLRPSLDFKITPSGRNDIVCTGGHLGNFPGARKVAGQAFSYNESSRMHHGTILGHVDFAMLEKCLRPSIGKLQSKGIKSVRSRVMNLSELVTTPKPEEEIYNALCSSFVSSFSENNKSEILNEPILSKDPEFSRIWHELMSTEWTLGQTPAFEASFKKRFHWGSVDFHLEFKDGKVKQAYLYTDSLFPEPLQNWARKLEGLNVHLMFDELHSAFPESLTEEERSELSDLRFSLLEHFFFHYE